MPGSKSVALKIGVCNDLQRRLSQLNAGIPPAARGRWIIRMQAEFSYRASAETAEQAFKDNSNDRLENLGGEFFWGADLDALVLFSGLPGVSRF